MKCPKCDLEVKPLPEVKSNGELVQIGGHVIDGVDCLTRQLAAKSAECEKLREACLAVADAINKSDLNGAVIWINPPYQLSFVHESATERLADVLGAEIDERTGELILHVKE